MRLQVPFPGSCKGIPQPLIRPNKAQRMIAYSSCFSDLLTIPNLFCGHEKPPAGVHVVVDFNRNVAVHNYPADLADDEKHRTGMVPGSEDCRGG